MASSIEWLRGDDGQPGETWNPTLGCDRVSPGCDGCYAIVQARIRSGNPKMAAAYEGLVHRVHGRLDWTGRINVLPERLAIPLQRRKPTRFFVDSMSDLFHKDVPDSYIARVFAVMAATPQHTYQVLTKRHGRMRSLLSSTGFDLAVAEAWSALGTTAGSLDGGDSTLPWPLPNVWLGVSAEDQQRADLRIPALMDTPAAVRWVSAEPLLGPVDLSRWLVPETTACQTDGQPETMRALAEPGRAVARRNGWTGLDWVVVGGESGTGARAMHPDWARRLRDQAVQAGAAFWFKQWGAWGPAPFLVRVCDPAEGWKGTEEELEAAKRDSEARGATHVHTGDPLPSGGYHLHEIGHKPWSTERVGLPAGMEPMRRWGKKCAGAELDGRVWEQHPDGAR